MTIHGRFMRQIHILSGFAALLAAALITLAGCDDGSSSGGNAKTLSSIAITAKPVKTAYLVGESLDAAGMVVTAAYSDGSEAAVIGYTASGFDSSAAAENQTVTVSYTEGEITLSAEFTVVISLTPRTLSSIAITAPPQKVVYTVGEPLDTTGMSVTATYSDGSSEEVSDLTVSGFDSREAAESQFVTVSYTYGGILKTAGFSVAVKPPITLSSIAITAPPEKVVYTVGEPLDTAGMAVTAAYSDGSSEEVSGYTPSGFDSGAPAASQTVTVSYTYGEVTKTATFKVSITAIPSSPAGIGYYWVNEDDLQVSADSTVSAAGSMTVTPQSAGYTDQYWYLNGVEDSAQRGSPAYVFNAAGKEAGNYTIVLRVKKDSRYYSAAFIITVTN